MASSPLAEKVKGCQDWREREHHCERWGIDVIVRSPGGKMREAIELAVLNSNTEAEQGVAVLKLFPALVAECTLDPNSRARVFSDDDIEWLADKNREELYGIANIALELAGIGEAAVTAAGNA